MTPLSDNNSISANTSSVSPANAPTDPANTTPSIPTPLAASTSTPTTIQSLPEQETPNGIYRLFHPPTPFPMRVRGVIVHALWSHAPIIPASLDTRPSEMSKSAEQLGSWYITHFSWKLASDAAPEPWIDEDETIRALTTIKNYVDALADAQPDDQQARLIYQILQVRMLEAKIPRFFRQRTYRLHYHISKTELQDGIINTRRSFVSRLQKQFGLHEEDTHNALVPSTFRHYDQSTHSKGWIVLNPQQALLAGVDESDARILAGLLQRRDVGQTKQQKGITPDRYDDVLGRVSLWNTARDISETVDQVANLASSGQKATDGQVLLSLALAVIGILVSFSPSLHFSTIHLWGTFGLLSLASILFWCHAHSGNMLWLRLGLLTIVCMLLLDIVPI